MLDDLGRARDVAWIVAAEWVAIVTTVGADGARHDLVPGGTAHAVPRHGTRTACGVGLTRLELFAAEFRQVEWAAPCDRCTAGSTATTETPRDGA